MCGNYTWVIKSVSEKLKLKQFLYSNPFYTSPSGYRVCVSIALNGFGPGEDTHIGLGLFMMKGLLDYYSLIIPLFLDPIFYLIKWYFPN